MIDQNVLPLYTGSGAPVAGTNPVSPTIPSNYFDSTNLKFYRSKYVSGGRIVWNIMGAVINSTVDPTLGSNATAIALIANQEDLIIYNNSLYQYNSTGSTWSSISGTSPSFKKKYYASPTGVSTNNGFSEQTPMDLQTALDTTGGTGNKVEVLPGTYIGNYTMGNSILNADIKGGNRGIYNIQGSLTINTNIAGESNSITGMAIDTLILNGTTGVYLDKVIINTSFTKTSTCYLNCIGCDFQGKLLAGTVAINGASTSLFEANNKIGFLTINNATADVGIINNTSCSPIALQTGVLSIGNGIIYSATETGNALNATGGMVRINGATFLTPTREAARINIGAGVFYTGLASASYDKVNSTISASAFNLDTQNNAVLPPPQVRAIMSVAAAKSTLPDGLVIFQVTPTDGLPSGISLNDIVRKTGTTYTLYQNYTDSKMPSSIAIGTPATAITYDKDGNGSWQSPVTLITAVNNSSNKNYLLAYNGNFETGLTSPWYKVSVPMTGSVPTGAPVAGGASITTFNINTTTPLAGKNSLQIATTGALAVGDGFSILSGNIDSEDQGKLISVRGYYKATAGTFNFSTTTPTLQMWIWDTVNSKYIALVNPSVFSTATSSTSGAGIINAQFQASYNMTSFQLVTLRVNATSGAVAMLFDDMSVGPQAPSNYGAIITSPTTTTFTSVLSAPTTAPTAGNILPAPAGSPANSYNRFSYWRNGKYLMGSFSFAQNTVGSAGVGTYLLKINNLPNFPGLSIDTNYQNIDNANPGLSNIGSATLAQSYGINNPSRSSGNVHAYDTTSLAISLEIDSGTTETNLQNFWSSSFYMLSQQNINVSGNFIIPIANWDAGITTSSQVPQTYTVARGLCTATAVAANAPIGYTFSDDKGSITSGGNRITAPFLGYYLFTGSMQQAAGTASIRPYVNGALATNARYLTTSSTNVTSFSFILYLNAQDYVQIYTDTALTPTVNSGIEAMFIGGNQAIATDPSVYASYQNSAGTAITTTATAIPFATLIKDTNYTILINNTTYITPISGTYKINVKLKTANAVIAMGLSLTINVYVNGVLYKELSVMTMSITLATALQWSLNGSCNVYNCIAGQTSIEIYAVTTGGTINLSNVGSQNYLDIERIG